MKTLTFCIALMLTLISRSEARIFETPEQCQERYGEHDKEFQADEQVLWRWYTKNGYDIRVVFAKPKNSTHYYAQRIIYAKLGKLRNEPLSKEEIEKFLQINSDGKTWKRVDMMKDALAVEGPERNDLVKEALKFDTWNRSDGVLIARYNRLEDKLSFSTTAILVWFKQREQNKLSDF